MLFYQYRKSHCVYKTVIRLSYLHNDFSYSGKMSSSLYWIRAHMVIRVVAPFQYPIRWLVISSHEDSKPWEWYFSLLNLWLSESLRQPQCISNGVYCSLLLSHRCQFENLKGTQPGVLSGCLSNFREIRQFFTQITWFWDFARSYDKTSKQIAKWTSRCFDIHTAIMESTSFTFWWHLGHWWMLV